MRDYITMSKLEQSEKEAVAWLNQWSDKEIHDGKCIKELFTINGFPLWWMMDEWLYENTIYDFCIKDILVDKKMPQIDMNINLKEKMYNSLVRHYFRYKPYIRKTWFKLHFKNSKFDNYKNKIMFLCYPILFNYVGTWKSTKNNEYYENLPMQNILVEVENNGMTIYNDEFLGITYHFNNDVIYVDVSRSTEFGLNNIFKIKKQKYMFLDKYFNHKINKQAKDITKEFKEKFKEISEDIDFISSLKYKGYPISKYMIKQINRYFDMRCEDHVRNYLMAEKMINDMKPNVIFIPTITGPFERAVYHICNKNNIKTLSLQQGTINDTYVGYVHRFMSGYPYPTKTLVWGKFYKDLLINNGFPVESIEITGSPRYDQLVCLEEPKNKKKPILLLVTAPFGDKVNRKIALDAYECAKQLDMQLIIKIHPNGEKISYYKNVLKGKKDVTILQNENIYSLINTADVVLTVFSTSCLETVIIGKPLVIYDFGFSDSEMYFDVALKVKNYDELVSTISKIKGYKNTKQREEFIEKYCYKIDGNASERIAQLML